MSPGLLVGGAGAAFLALSLSIYGGVLDAPFVFDDAKFVNEPLMQVRSLEEIGRLLQARGQPRKVGLVTFALNHLWSGAFVPRLVRVVSLVLHLMNAVLLFLLLRQLTPDSPPRAGPSHAALAFGVAVWLVHPIQTQAVAYAWQRFTPLVSVLYLGSLLALRRAAAPSAARGVWYGLAALAALLALGTKENAAMLPLVALLMGRLVPPRGHDDAGGDGPGGRTRRLLVVGGAVITAAAIAAYYLGPNWWEMIVRDSLHRGFTPWQRVMTEWRVVVYYVTLLLWPAPSRLNLDYEWPLSTDLLSPATTLASLLALAAAAGLAVTQARKRPLLALALGWFLANLAIESSFIPLDLVFEHRLYLPSMLPVALGTAWLIERVPPGVLRGGAALVLVGGLAVLAHRRNEVWKDPVALWEDTARKSPGKARPHWNLGKSYFMKGDYERARRPTERALELDPTLTGALTNLAAIEMAAGRPSAARDLLRKALAQEEDHVPALSNLGVVELRLGNSREAIAPFEKALALEPGNETVAAGLVAAHYNLGEHGRAAALAEAGRERHPRSARLWAFHGAALAQLGRHDDARRALNEALRLDPQQPVARDALARLR